MRRVSIGTALAGMGVAVAAVALAPQASAYPVGPWGVEGPCAGKQVHQCPMSPSDDGLTWAFHGDGYNYDKYGKFVCMSSAFYCGPLMAIVRAAPPAPVGNWLHP